MILESSGATAFADALIWCRAHNRGAALCGRCEGSGTQLEIKNADVELRNAKITKTKSIHDYIVAKAELDQLMGKMNDSFSSYIKYKEEN